MSLSWDNPYQKCKCDYSCSCGGGMHSYLDPYREVIELFKPSSVLEWGPGLNTYLALLSGAFVYSIEQEIQFVPKTSSKNYKFLVTPIWSSEYIKLPKNFLFDMFFVDSRRRSECIEFVYENCKYSDILCVHDAQRERYHISLRKFPYVKFLNRGFCLASKNKRILMEEYNVKS